MRPCKNIVTLDDGDGQLTDLINADNVYNNGLSSGSLLLRPDSVGEVPPFIDPAQPNIHWAYYYSSIGRPGVSVREFVGTETTTNGYWRFNTPYGYQLGSGYEGDQPNDFKFVFGGAVYRVPDSDFRYYGAYGSLWTMLPDSDPDGAGMPRSKEPPEGPPAGHYLNCKASRLMSSYTLRVSGPARFLNLETSSASPDRSLRPFRHRFRSKLPPRAAQHAHLEESPTKWAITLTPLTTMSSENRAFILSK